LFSRDELPRTVLVMTVAALLGIGAVMTFSTTSRGDGPLISPSFLKQLLYVAIGVSCAAWFAVRGNYRVLLRMNWVVFGAAVLLLIGVLIPGLGHYANGAWRWYRIGPVSFQPSEFGKLALIVCLAGFLGSTTRDMRSFARTLVPALCCMAVICALVLKEPDIGTTALLGLVSCLLIFLSGVRLLFLLAPLPALVPLALHILNTPYARTRIEIWLNPWKDPLGAGYHIIQSLIAIGSGGTWGVGLGASTQKLYFLPEASSDFIFAILAEESGLVGATLVMLLYVAFIWAGIAIARRAPDKGAFLLASGITSLIALQAAINIAVVTKALPTKGIPLPFISAGGSSAVFMLIGVGILYNIARSSESPATN